MADTGAPDMLMGASENFLRRFSPFDRLEADAMAFLVERLELGFHPRDSEILSAEMGPPAYLYLVQRGQVQSRQSGVGTPGDAETLILGPGECFPIGALSANRPSANVYTAIEDSFVFRLPAADFHRLMTVSPIFHLFCTHYIASLLHRSRQQLQVTLSQRAAEQQTMATPLAKLLSHEPVHVGPETSTRDALTRMADARIGCMIVVDDARRPVGIVTQRDVLTRVVLAGVDLGRPIADVMTASPRTLPDTAVAYDAALQMATHGIRHLLVVDGQGVLQGVVSERDLFSLQRLSLRQIRAGIDSAEDVAGYRRASDDIRQFALNLVAQGVGAEQLTQFISALNDALTCHIITIEAQRHQVEDIDFAWLAFGSEGRHEQTLSTDQDNGIIFAAADDAIENCRERLLRFARTVNEDLAACGFPLCKGNIMASNPALCLTLGEWQRRFDQWIREPQPEALLNATIFFDFRVLHGNLQHGDRLRAWLNQNARRYPNFLRMMAENALAVAPPIGRIRDFVMDEDDAIDLKTFGARLFVDAARIFALRAEVASSNTAQRLREAGQRMGVMPDEISAIIDGFHFIQMLRLRAQHLDLHRESSATQLGENRIRPDELNELDRRILKEAFRQARKMQLRLKLDYQL